MSSTRTTSLGAALILTAALTGCSTADYTDRRDTISLAAGDAVASNKLTHMVDPWPRVSANRNIAYDGDRMQRAAERYRTNKVTVPVNAMTSSTPYQQAQPVVQSTGKP